MTIDVSQLQQTKDALLSAERVFDALESQRIDLDRKIKVAIQAGKTDDLAQVRHELFTLETKEIPLAQITRCEAAITFHESQAAEHEREAAVLRQRLDEVFGRRDRRMKEISEEFHALQLDRSGEISEARRLLMNAQNSTTQSKEQAQQYRERLAQPLAKQQQSAAL